MGRRLATRALERALQRCGFVNIAGVDEVGRGCLAGPVVAAAVILDPACRIPGLADSKLLSPAARASLDARIRTDAVAWAVAEVDAVQIDLMRIQRASLEAMRLAVAQLVPQPDFVLVDAFRIAGLRMAQRGIIHGDRRVASIAAASIVAKVHRDGLMTALHDAEPRYGFDHHKGYGTAAHIAAIAQFGMTRHHRRSFRVPSLFETLHDTPSAADTL
jgi:ribonuclease HII